MQKITLTGLFLLICVGYCLPCNAQQKGWSLTQRSDFMGDQYVYVCKNGFKWVNPKAGANIVTQGPGWTVIMYNSKTKQYFQTTLEKWKRQVLSTGGRRAKEMRKAGWRKSGSGTISGLKATKYVMDGKASGLKTVKRASCWVSDDIQVPAPIADMLNSAYGMPRTRYFPLRVTYLTNSGQVKTALNTYQSSICAIPGNYFTRPKGYALASSQAEIMMDDETRQLLRDMAGEIDGQRPAPRKQAVKRVKQAPKNKPKPGSTSDQLTKLLDSLKGK